MGNDDADERSFNERAAEYARNMDPDFTRTLSILIVGRVSTGKSSLINALFERNRLNPIFAVRAEAGVTRETQWANLSEAVAVGDSPGLQTSPKLGPPRTYQREFERRLGLT